MNYSRVLAIEQTNRADDPYYRHDSENYAWQFGKEAVLVHSESLAFGRRFYEAANCGDLFLGEY